MSVLVHPELLAFAEAANQVLNEVAEDGSVCYEAIEHALEHYSNAVHADIFPQCTTGMCGLHPARQMMQNLQVLLLAGQGIGRN